MSTSGYETFFQSSEFGPNWMHGPWGKKFWAAIGRVLDAQNDLLRASQSARTPDGAVELAMSDALDRQGDDRLLARGGTAPDEGDESNASYAARLKDAFDTWGQHETDGAGAGSVKGILTQLKIAGFPVEPTPPNYLTTGCFLINHLGRIYQLVSDELNVVGDASACVNRQQLDGTIPSPRLPGWTLDARDQFYSRWMLLFAEDVPELTNADNLAKARLNEICNRWKSASAKYCGCAVVPNEEGAVAWGWPVTIKWGQASLNWGTNGARFIEPE
jgi:hypothetical protein